MKITPHLLICYVNEVSQVFRCFLLFELLLAQNENPEKLETFESLKTLNFVSQVLKHFT